MIFTAIKTVLQVRELKKGLKDPSGFAQEKVIESIIESMLYIFIPVGIVSLLLFLFGYTHVFTNPSGLARVFFWIILIPSSLFAFIVYKALYFLRRKMKQVDKTIKAEIREIK